MAGRIYSTSASALITVAMNWTHRLIGIISMAILARLLVPEDFGIVAMASLVITLADVLLNLGVHVPLIQNQAAGKAHYDSAWTLRLIQTVISTAILFLLAPVAAEYFRDGRVEIVLQVLAFSLLLGGLENIGIIEFQKKMQFGSEFRFRFLRRILGFFVTLGLAIALRSYWALVIGTIAEKSFGIFLSYRLHPMRPHINFGKFREIFGVSQWMLIFNVGVYLRLSLHRLLVGRWATAAIMGSYSLADEIARMPSNELLSPVNRALFPAFAKANASDIRLKEMFLLALGIQTLIAVPAAVGLALVADELVLVVLGEKWRIAAPFLEILALINIAQALTASGTYVMLARGHTRMNAIFIWLQVALFVALVITPLIAKTAMGIAGLLLAVSVISLWFQFWLVIRSLPILRLSEIAAASYRPLLASIVMAVIVLHFPLDGIESLLLLMIIKVLVGASSYIAAMFLLWRLSGCSSGAESYIIEKVRDLAPRFRW